MKTRYKIIITAGILISIPLILSVIYKHYIYYKITEALITIKMPQEEVVKPFVKNKERFIYVADFLKKMDGKIYIRNLEEGKYTVLNNINDRTISVTLNNKKVTDEIYYILFKLRYRYISEEGNSVYFRRQSGIGFDQGVAYSKDGKAPDWYNITVVEPIKDGWYYYESR